MRLGLGHGAHVREEEGHVELRRRAVGQVLEQQVVRLRDVHVLLGDTLCEAGQLEHLLQRPRPVDHLEAPGLIEAELRHEQPDQA